MITYGERYEEAIGWVERHVAQDMMLAYGRDAQVSESDMAQLERCRQRDAAGK